MPLPVERSQGSVSALVARFQIAANREKEASEREKEKDRERVSLGEGRRVSDVVAAKEGVSNVDLASQSTACSNAKTVPIDSSDEKDTIKGNAPGNPSHPLRHASPIATLQNGNDTARVSPSTSSTTPAKSTFHSSTKSSPDRTSSIKPPARSTPAEVKDQSETDKPRTLSTQHSAKETSVPPSPSTATSPPSTTANGSTSTSAPLKPQLTGTPSKPTASSLAKTRSPPSSHTPGSMSMRSPPPVDNLTAAGAKRRNSSSFGRRDSLKSPLSSSGSLTGRSSLGRAASARLSQSRSPEATSTVSGQRRVSEDGSASPQPQEKNKEGKNVKGPIGRAAGSRLMQGTAASRARMAANTDAHSSSISSNSHVPISRTSPVSTNVTRPRASISTPASNSKKPTSNENNNSSGKRLTPKSNSKDATILRPNVSSVAKEGKENPAVKPIGRNPVGRLGLAAARERKGENEDEIQAPHPPPIGKLGLPTAREKTRMAGGKWRGDNVVKPFEQQPHHVEAELKHEQKAESETGAGEEEKQKSDGTMSEPAGEAEEELEEKDGEVDVRVSSDAGPSSFSITSMRPEGVQTRQDGAEDREETKCAGEPTEPFESVAEEGNVRQNKEINETNRANETNDNDNDDSEDEKEEGREI
ncbi:extensin [Cryptococcus neoformans C23]|uniref:Extensin n=1 Tax=Cryptococcus neoformans (strain H99 / ATCC 208821 / CBS 10515 / FGSC 9487) TaxID=235443 RepID=J9W260_CRYN9|nr:extensin [Cryptococcus neoformans var. grubii H99]AFR98205.2 extensin [Cryptococcus neoformans var. grubii H99]AUB28313.1 extensin [Cryptococcus neoformans var. grubii]OWZ39560.1 extensin [Cryptococcus neoformans var. grubii C23]OXG36861.1 extensin [Cryptococcus neoformans var. grubii Bt15]|eukprot:XP_012052534.1 extensin [Cryptococcus neoformans var. grubii H99]